MYSVCLVPLVQGFPQSKGMRCRLMDISKLLVVCVNVSAIVPCNELAPLFPALFYEINSMYIPCDLVRDKQYFECMDGFI